MTLFLDPLDRLLEEALTQDRRRRFKKLPSPKPLALRAISLRENFANPDNWLTGSVLTLIHRETQSVLGVFQESRHRRIDIRQLHRISTPMPIDKIEYVSGNRWLNSSPPWEGQYLDSPDRNSSIELYFNLSLPELGVSADQVRIEVCLESGWIRSVLLKEPILLSSPCGKSHISLPSGVNVLDIMGHDNKVSLRRILSGT